MSETQTEEKVQEKEEVVIFDEVETTDLKEKEFDIGGLLPEEVEMAKEAGLVKEKEEPNGDNKEQSELKTDDNTESEEVKDDETPTFDEVEKNEDLKEKYNKNEKALYFKWKSDKRKRQQSTKLAEDLQNKLNFNQAKDNAYKAKLDQARELLGKDDLTIEQLQEVLGKAEEIAKSEEDIKQEVVDELKNKQSVSQADQDRTELAEEIGRSKYEDFDDKSKIVAKLLASDKTGFYQDILNATFDNKNIDEEGLADRVYKLADIGKDLGLKLDKPEPKTNEKVDRAIKNSKKKISSAAVSSGGGKRAVSHDDLTQDDVPGMSQEQWNKLPDAVQDRLLGKT